MRFTLASEIPVMHQRLLGVGRRLTCARQRRCVRLGVTWQQQQ